MTHDEAEDFLAHYGKKGMRWGQRMSNIDTGAPSRAKGLALGVYGRAADYKNKDAKALRLRGSQARKAAVVGAGLSFASLAISSVARNPATQLGADVVGRMLLLGTGVNAVRANVLNTRAVFKETKKP